MGVMCLAGIITRRWQGFVFLCAAAPRAAHLKGPGTTLFIPQSWKHEMILVKRTPFMTCGRFVMASLSCSTATHCHLGSSPLPPTAISEFLIGLTLPFFKTGYNLSVKSEFIQRDKSFLFTSACRRRSTAIWQSKSRQLGAGQASPNISHAFKHLWSVIPRGAVHGRPDLLLVLVAVLPSVWQASSVQDWKQGHLSLTAPTPGSEHVCLTQALVTSGISSLNPWGEHDC